MTNGHGLETYAVETVRRSTGKPRKRRPERAIRKVQRAAQEVALSAREPEPELNHGNAAE